MYLFIINLKDQVEKKQNLERFFDKKNIKNYEFIEAIDGRVLTKQELSAFSIDYPQNSLTPGEIGCALSHLKVYEIMVQRNLQSAIILEDDIVLPDDFSDLAYSLKDSLKTPQSKILSLAKPDKINILKTFGKYNQYSEYTAISAFGGYAYAINLSAAKSFLKHLLPITFEADMFIHFRENGWLDIFNVLYPQAVKVIENHDELSTLYLGRINRGNSRTRYRKNLLKKRPFFLKLKIKLQKNIRKIGQSNVQKH